LRGGNREKKYPVAPVYSPLWNDFFALAKRSNATKPWELFENEDVFIVEDPRDAQLYLCCVMGNAGEEFGLNALRGPQGMRNFEEIVYADSGSGREFRFTLDMLSYSLSPRDFMEKHDLKVIKKHLLNFPGGMWPLLRSLQSNGEWRWFSAFNGEK
jgi:hypothetical protein